MAQVIDIEIIANALFKSLLTNITYSENNLSKLIEKNNENIYNIINLINNCFEKLYSYIDNKILNQIIKTQEYNSCCSLKKDIKKKNYKPKEHKTLWV